MELLELMEGEAVVYEKSGDYWTSGLAGTKIPGVFQMTNKRLTHRGKTILGTAKNNSFEIELRDIVSFKKCNVGDGLLKIIPTGVKLQTADGSAYTISVLKREEFIKALEENK